MKYPLGMVVLVYIAGLVLGDHYQLPLPLSFGISFLFAAATLLINRIRLYLIWPLIFLAGWTNLTSQTAILSPYDLRIILRPDSEDVIVRGTLVETPNQRVTLRHHETVTRSLAQVKVTEIKRKDVDWQPAFGYIMTTTPGPPTPDFYKGCHVEIPGIIAEPDGPIRKGLFDYRAYLRRKCIYFEMHVDTNAWQLVPPLNVRRPLADKFILWAQRTMARDMPEEDEPLRLLWSMTLGWRATLSYEIYEPFMQTGTMHIFAISGLHIALIAAILVAILRVMRVPRLWSGIVVIPLIWFYTAATGWQPSAIRSSLMTSIIVGGWALNRPSNLINSLAFAALVILLWDPQQLFQAGFQLSFLVVLSIALILPPLEKLRDRLLKTDPLLPVELLPRWQRWSHTAFRWIGGAVATSFAAWLGSWPLTAYYFHIFSPITLLANLVVVPVSSAALACNMASIICGSWLPFFTDLFNHTGWLCMWFMVKFSIWAASLPCAFQNVPQPKPADFIIYYSVLFGLLSGWFFKSKSTRWIFAASLIVIASFYGYRWHEARDHISLNITPLHGGSSVLCKAPDSASSILVDCGDTNAVETIMKPFLQSQGVNSIPHLILTHGDLRQVGGVEPLCELLPVDQIVTSPVNFLSRTYRRLSNDVISKRENSRKVSRNDKIGNWTVLHPDSSDKFPQADDNAIVLHADFSGTRILLLSDLGRPGQNALMERNPGLKADIVVTGLPTDSEPLCDNLLDSLQPKVIIVTDSQYPAPKQASLKLYERLEGHGIPVIYTRKSAIVGIDITSKGWKLQAGRGFKLSSDALFPNTASSLKSAQDQIVPGNDDVEE